MVAARRTSNAVPVDRVLGLSRTRLGCCDQEEVRARFRDALVRTSTNGMAGEALLNTTVEESLVSWVALGPRNPSH